MVTQERLDVRASTCTKWGQVAARALASKAASGGYRCAKFRSLLIGTTATQRLGLGAEKCRREQQQGMGVSARGANGLAKRRGRGLRVGSSHSAHTHT